MSKHRKEITNDADTLAEDAQSLLNATSEVAGEKVAEARERLSVALERSKEMYDEAKEKAIAAAQAGDKFVRNNPYAALGIAIGIGALIGLMLSRRSRD